MSARQGWIGEPQPAKESQPSHRHTPCPTCGQMTWFKQYRTGCACDVKQHGR